MRILKHQMFSTLLVVAISIATATFGSEVVRASESVKLKTNEETRMSSSSEQQAVIDTINNYLTGISHADIAQERLQLAFYSSTNLHTLDENGNLQFQPRDSLIQYVESGAVPEHSGHILTVEITNDMAFAKVHLDLPDRHFYDYLTLLKLNVGWRIVSKTYTTVMK